MPVNPLTQQALDLLKAGRVISIVSAPTRRLADARGLILLSQLVYWTVKDRRILETGGWFSKSHQDWMRETCLSRHCLASSLKLLQEAGLVKVWQRMSRTAPWYKLDLNRLNALCQGSEDEILLARFVVDTPWRESILGRPLPYYTRLAEAVDDALLGLFLSRCVYWQDALEQRGRLTAKKPVWGWSSNDWFNDIGITRAQLRNLLKQAEKLGFIRVVTEGRPFPGISVDFGVIAKAINVPDSVASGADQAEQNSVVSKCPVHTADGTFRDRGIGSDEEALEALLIGVGQAEQNSIVPKCSVRSVDGAFRDRTAGAGESAYTECPVHTADRTFRAQGLKESVATLETLLIGASQAGQNSAVSKCPVHTADGTFRDRSIGTDEIRASGFTHLSHGFSQAERGFVQPEHGFDQSTRARGFDYFDYRDYTTTTPTSPHCGSKGVVVVLQQKQGSSHKTAFLAIPAFFSPGSEYPIEPLLQIIASALPHRQQDLLDELDGLMTKGIPRNPYSYLRALVKRDNEASGGLVLEHAHCAHRRRSLAAALVDARERATTAPSIPPAPASVSAAPPLPADREDSRSRIDDLWAAIGKAPPATTQPKGENP